MEFGALIPLWYMSMCCLISTPLVGIAALAYVRFSLHDKALTKYIIATVLSVSLLWFLFPFAQLLFAAYRICRDCPDSNFRITKDVLSNTFAYAARLALLPGTASGFVLAIIFVVPTIILIRRFRKG